VGGATFDGIVPVVVVAGRVAGVAVVGGKVVVEGVGDGRAEAGGPVVEGMLV